MSKDDYPDALTTKHIMQILQVSQTTALRLLQQAEQDPDSFCVRRIGSGYRAGKEGFYRWLNTQRSQ